MEGQGCIFCGAEKENENIHICSKCAQRLLVATDEQLISAMNLAIEKGYTEKAKAIENFTGVGIGGEVQNDNKTKKSERNLGRKRVGRKARSTHNTIGS